MSIPYYLKVGRAADFRDKKERKIFRALEIFPGAFSCFTLITIILLSWLKPVWMAIFIIAFAIYWLFRTIYFSFYLNASYRQIRKHEKTNWIKKLEVLPARRWQDIYHLIIIPRYQESLEIIRDALQSLLENDYPKDKIIVVLTCEARVGKEAEILGEAVKKEFAGKFFRLLITYHPESLPGEIIGKGANDAWGGREAKEKIIDPLKIPYENIIVSDFDADTVVFPKYFSCLTYHYLTAKNPTRTSFQPVPFYINNIWQAPLISRIFAFSGSFWQMMCQERPEKLVTFSSHAMSFRALVDVGFRQINVVSDDSRIFWQCFFRYDGDYRVQPLYYPISMDANVAPSFFRTMKNIYKQQRRWAYGVGEIPYYLFAFWKNKKIPLSKKIQLGATIFEGHWAWATNSIIIFLLGWLPLVLGGNAFGQTLLSHNLPIFTSRILTLAMFGLVGSAYFSIMLLPSKPPNYGKRKYLFFALEWLLIPIVMIFFTSLPALDAQIRWMLGKYMGFWATEKVRK